MPLGAAAGGVHHGQGRGIGMLENGEIGGALAIDMHDIGLDGIGILDEAYIAQKHWYAVHHPDGDVAEFVHRIGA